MMDGFCAAQHANTGHESSQVSFRLGPKRTVPEFQQAARGLFRLVSAQWPIPLWEFSLLSAGQLFQSLPGGSVEPAMNAGE